MDREHALDVVVVGLAVVDILGRPVSLAKLPKRGGLQIIDSLSMATGGNVANYGIDLAKLGFRVGAITRVGDDEFGRFVLRRLADHGIETTGVIVDGRRQTSSTFVAIGKDGERTFLHTRGSLVHFRAQDVLDQLPMIRRAALLAFGYLGLLPECEKDLPGLFSTLRKEAGVKILLDTGGNPRRKPALLKRILPYVDFFLPSLDEAIALTGRTTPALIVRACRDAGATGVVGIKLGARGSYVDTNETAAFVPARRIRRVVDATGAGDAFIAGFIAATLRGNDPFQAARFGNLVAADCITAIGASTAVRRYEDYMVPETERALTRERQQR